MDKQNQYIGIFDSGVGGLTVWKELSSLLPNESFLYYADSANCPYGAKSKEEIIALSKSIVEFFLSKNVKLIVVACNTATAAAIDFLRDNYDIPFVGMEPAIKPAALNTKKGVVGVLATEGTFNGRLFNQTSQKYASDIQVEVQVGEGFVELVEKGEINTLKAEKVISKALIPLLDQEIDQLVLACTHYPFLSEIIKKISKGRLIEIINPAPSIAKQTKSLLAEYLILNTTIKKANNKFFSSSTNIDILKMLVKEIDSTVKAEYYSDTCL